MQHDEIQDLFANKTFDRRGPNIHVNLVRSEYGGIQGSWAVRKCGKITQDEFVNVTIKIGGKTSHVSFYVLYTDVTLLFRCSKDLSDPSANV